jgi:hypothetical protein
MKSLKNNLPLGEASRVRVPNRKAILTRLPLRSGNWRSLRSLAMAEQPKPCKRQVDYGKSQQLWHGWGW